MSTVADAALQKLLDEGYLPRTLFIEGEPVGTSFHHRVLQGYALTWTCPECNRCWAEYRNLDGSVPAATNFSSVKRACNLHGDPFIMHPHDILRGAYLTLPLNALKRELLLIHQSAEYQEAHNHD